jgi:hypothetical protein
MTEKKVYDLEDIRIGRAYLDQLWNDFYRNTSYKERMDSIAKLVDCLDYCPCIKYGQVIKDPSRAIVDECCDFEGNVVCRFYATDAKNFDPDKDVPCDELSPKCKVWELLDTLALACENCSEISRETKI